MKCIAYLRISKDKNGTKGLSEEGQIAVIEEMIGEVVAVYRETKSGASTANRKELDKAIKHCQREKLTLAVEKVDRLGRDTEDNLRIYRRLNGNLRICQLPPAGDEHTFTLQLTILSAIATYERALISARTKAALKALKARGVKLGSPQNLTDEGRARSAAVKRQQAKDFYRDQYDYIKTLRDDLNMSYRRIAQTLNEQGKRTRQGKDFQGATVYRILARGNGD